MLERPFLVVADLATRIQNVASRTAEKATRTANALRARAAERERARALKAARKPGIHFVRDLKYNRMCFSFYRKVDRYGNAETFWTLTKDTRSGRVRLATGTMDDFKDIRAATLRTLYRGHGRGQDRGIEEQRRLQPEQLRQEQPAQVRGRVRQGTNGPQMSTGQKKTADLWYSLVLLEGRNADGTFRTRVLKSFTDLNRAKAVAMQNPRLAIYHRPSRRPPQQGTVINADKGDLSRYRPREQQRRQGAPQPSICVNHVAEQTPTMRRELSRGR